MRRRQRQGRLGRGGRGEEKRGEDVMKEGRRREREEK